LALLYLSAWSFFGEPEAGGVGLLPCPIHSLTGVSCPGCGITRACLSLVQGDLVSAWSYHPFAFFLVPLAVLVFFAPGPTRKVWRTSPRWLRGTFVGAGLVCLLGLWIVRLL
ncbi:MAG: hypothetical protein ACI9F9_000108, partial [Candidatus Paceibacteria bacterium]